MNSSHFNIDIIQSSSQTAQGLLEFPIRQVWELLPESLQTLSWDNIITVEWSAEKTLTEWSITLEGYCLCNTQIHQTSSPRIPFSLPIFFINEIKNQLKK